ncbi:hypothetical protein L596_000722 [Steinernema carpocapsae]|uniref:Secreted protein n=1 Tax=Steinernema carpocapsae TaxID=34508 RepID=A0A4V6I6Y6_STECR|nr:hypothetical protein L596_000722 [Steinernema carpocapsae]
MRPRFIAWRALLLVAIRNKLWQHVAISSDSHCKTRQQQTKHNFSTALYKTCTILKSKKDLLTYGCKEYAEESAAKE